MATHRIAGAGWLALHLVLLGVASNAIVVWSEQDDDGQQPPSEVK